MGEQSRETLVSSIFSSNGAQQYFMNETEYHASFYCRNSGGTSFFKGPLSYADSWAYCENHDGTLGEFYHFFQIIYFSNNIVWWTVLLLFVQWHPCSKKSTGRLEFLRYGLISSESISRISSSGIHEPSHIFSRMMYLGLPIPNRKSSFDLKIRVLVWRWLLKQKNCSVILSWIRIQTRGLIKTTTKSIMVPDSALDLMFFVISMENFEIGVKV